jgi:hypothetical protein
VLEEDEDDEELEVLLLDEEELDDENRLVEARSAADMLLPLDEPDDEAADDDDEDVADCPALELTLAVGLLLDPPPPPPRPRSERLPRNRGAISDAKCSAPVDPVSRIALSTVPNPTGAVRIAATAWGFAGEVRLASRQYTPAATTRITTSSQIHHLRGGAETGRGGTTCGTPGGVIGRPGAGALLLIWGCIHGTLSNRQSES